MKSAADDGTHAAILIIGYGNPLRGDDGVGFVLAERLAATIESTSMRVLACHQLTIDLAEPLSRSAHAIFIDASCEDSPGRFTRRAVNPETTAAADSHSLTPQALLGCAKVLYGRAPNAILFTIGGERFDYHQGLSKSVAKACNDLLPRIIEQVGAWQRTI